MTTATFFSTLKKLIKRASSLLMLFQRTPAAQILVPAEFNLASSAAFLSTAQFAIATVVGLGAYDSVAGATTMTQIDGSLNVVAGEDFSVTFQVTGSPSTPASWSVVGTLPTGLSMPNQFGDTNSITGTTTEVGSKSVTVQAWEGASFNGGVVQKNITIVVSAPAVAAINTHPASTTINSGQTTTLTVVAIGQNPLTYQWYQGTSGDTSTPVGTDSASFTTPALTATTGYWVKVTNAVNTTGADSTTAVVTIRQPAAITTQPLSPSINTGQTTTLSVIASGTGPLTYQWYQGASGSTTTPVGTNSASFTTPPLLVTTSYWVKVTNAANLTGANSDTATVTVTEASDPAIFTAATLPPAQTNVAYTTTLIAFGGSQPYTWTVTDGSLPDGFTLSEEGVISGTSGGTGTGSFTIQVTDQDLKTDSRIFEILVSDLDIATTTLPTAVKGTAYTTTLATTGGSAPFTWSLQGGALPNGISLSPTGVLSGTPTAAGNAAITVRVTDSTNFAVSKALLLPVSATFIKPVIDPITFPIISVGAAFNHTITAENFPKTYTITGLPKGLKAVPATGVITGIPEVSGVFNIQVRATNSAGASKLITAKLTVKPLPRNLFGSFGGFITRDSTANRSRGGQFNLTVTSNGRYTLKITGPLPNSSVVNGASGITSASGLLSAAAPNLVTTMAGAAVSLSIDPLTGNVTGDVGDASVKGCRAVWNATTNPAEELAGYYSMALDLADPDDEGQVSIPQGTGFATFTVGLGGSFVIAGKTADGETVTTSTFLGEEGDFWVFSPLYKGAGSLLGGLLLTPDAQSEFSGNTLGGTLSWLKPDTVTRTYASSFGTLDLMVQGAYLAPSSKGGILLGLPDAGTVQLRFTDGGLADADMDPDIDATYTDDNKVNVPASPAKTTLALNPNTGVMSGKFTLVETDTKFTRANIAFQGQVVRQMDGQLKAVGYFLLPQIPSSGQTAAAAPILSGGVSLLQQAP